MEARELRLLVQAGLHVVSAQLFELQAHLGTYLGGQGHRPTGGMRREGGIWGRETGRAARTEAAGGAR